MLSRSNFIFSKICNSISRTTKKNLTLDLQKRSGSSYEPEGKTTVQMLNQEAEIGIMINSISQVGFRLNNGMTVLGSMAVFPRTVLSWNVDNMSHITEESLSLFTILEPKIDIIVLGIGDDQLNLNFRKRIHTFMQKSNINIEILPTEQACATFNFLNAEKRNIGGVFIPPQNLKTTDDDLLQTKLRYQNLYKIED